MCCRHCLEKFCFCVELKNGVLIQSIIQLVITVVILIAAIIGVVLLEDREKFLVEIFHGVSSATVFFTSIYIIVLILLLIGTIKKKQWMLWPYLIYAIIYMLAYVVIIAYSTPIYFFYVDTCCLNIFTLFVVEIVFAIVGLCVQVYFYVVTYSYYRKSKEALNEETLNEETLNEEAPNQLLNNA